MTFKVNGYKKTGTLSVRIAPDILQHTHPLTEASWQHETQKRKLTTDEEHIVKELLTKNVPVAQITKVMVAETGKPIRPKDIHNLRGKFEAKTKGTGNSVQQISLKTCQEPTLVLACSGQVPRSASLS